MPASLSSHSALRVCVVGKLFSFQPGVYVGTLNSIVSVSGPSILMLIIVYIRATSEEEGEVRRL